MGLMRASLAACVTALLCGCASTTEGDASASAPPDKTASSATTRTSAPSRAPGLTLERLFVPEDPKARRDGLAQAVSDGLVERIDCGLAEAGFAAYRLRGEADLDRLIERLGGSPQRHETIMGRLVEWAECTQASVDAGRVISVSGRPRTMPEATLRLAMRGWCFPTVDSARARIELRVTTETAADDRPSIDRVVSRPRPRVVAGTETALELGPGEALVIVETPIVPPEDGGDGLGALPPPTPAALLLLERSIPGRATVLVVHAAFADMLPPSE